MNRLEQLITETLRHPDKPWFPELTESLVESGWHPLRAILGMSPASYSTARILLQDASAEQREELPLLFPIPGTNEQCLVEHLSDDLEALLIPLGLNVGRAPAIESAALITSIAAAFGNIAVLPSLHASVLHLVRRLHIVQTERADCDVSYSHPTIPFSIFVSVPEESAPNASFRLAESIIHEAMHLQLTLLERNTPLVKDAPQQFFSPWKNTLRDASGVLHALYVFTVIDEWLRLLPIEPASYGVRRRHEIAEQVKRTADFRSAELTPVGDSLCGYLFSRFVFE